MSSRQSVDITSVRNMMKDANAAFETIKILEKTNAAQAAHIARLKEAGNHLVLKMLNTYNDPKYIEAFKLYAVKHGDYDGLKWTHEFDDFAALLK